MASKEPGKESGAAAAEAKKATSKDTGLKPPAEKKSKSGSPATKKADAKRTGAKSKSPSRKGNKEKPDADDNAQAGGPADGEEADTAKPKSALKSGNSKADSSGKPPAAKGKSAAAKANSIASINCKCGAVKLELSSQKAVYHGECCCYDCSAALKHAHVKRGGPENPQGQVVDCIMFDNDFTVAKGQDKIGAFKSFAKGDTIRFHCTDCWTLLLSDYPLFQGRILMTQVGSYREFIGLQNAEVMDVMSRQVVKDLNPEQFGAVPAYTGDPATVCQSATTDLQDLGIFKAGKKGEQMNLQILLAKIGEPIIPKDDPLLTMGPETLMSQLGTGGTRAVEAKAPKGKADAKGAGARFEDDEDGGNLEGLADKKSAPRGRGQTNMGSEASIPTASEADSSTPAPSVPKASATSSTSRKQQSASAVLISSRPKISTSAAAIARGPKKEEKKEKKAKVVLAEERAGLANIMPLLGSKGNQLRNKDVEQLLNAAGGKVDADAIDAFMKEEMGGSTVSEAQLIEKATAYFNSSCVPTEDCMEVWQMVGGSLTGDGTVQTADLADVLAKLGCRLSSAESADLVAFASSGNDVLAYEDFVRVLFP